MILKIIRKVLHETDQNRGFAFMKDLSSHFNAVHRGAFFQFLFRWIHYCHSSKSTGKETGKTHLCAVFSFFRPSSSSFLLLLHFPPNLCCISRLYYIQSSPTYFVLKVRHCKKTTKIKNKWEVFSNFCGLFRKAVLLKVSCNLHHYLEREITL